MMYNHEQRTMQMSYIEYQNLISTSLCNTNDTITELLVEVLGYFSLKAELTGKDSVEERMCERIKKLLNNLNQGNLNDR